MTIAMAATLMAQNGTNSPYSQYGLGTLADQSQASARGMNGVGLAFRKGNAVNTLNPASYSAVDSLTFIFDAALSGQITNFKEGGRSLNAQNADFDYVVGTFRLMRGVGLSFGLTPYSSIGYNYSSTTYVDQQTGYIAETYSGSGGLRKVFVGAGWQLAKPLSVGVNVGYMWGDYNRRVASTGSTVVNSLTKSYQSSVSSYSIDAGVQWTQPFGKDDQLTLGATVGIGHGLGAQADLVLTNINSSTSVSVADTFSIADALSLPMSYGLGLGWTHGEKLFVGADVTLQKWGSVDYPDYNSTARSYALRPDLLKDRWRVAIGTDYVPDAMSLSLLKRIHYRIGAGYATPYYKVNGQDGPREISLSAGLGIPLQNAWNNRSVLNIGFQWANTSASGLIKENTLRFTVGLTFNERWFAKWRID